MLYVCHPLAGTLELGMIIAPPCNLDQFHDLLHHVMKEITGGPQVLGRMVGVPVMKETTVVMKEAMHLAGQGI